MERPGPVCKLNMVRCSDWMVTIMRLAVTYRKRWTCWKKWFSALFRPEMKGRNKNSL